MALRNPLKTVTAIATAMLAGIELAQGAEILVTEVINVSD